MSSSFFGGFWSNIPDVMTPLPDPAPSGSGGGGNGGGGTGGGGGGGGGGANNEGAMTRQEFLAAQRRQARIASREAAAARRVAGESAYDFMRQQLSEWGLDDPAVLSIIRDSRNEYEMLAEIRQTDTYRTRFAGNIARAKAGYGMLSEAEYLGLERSYAEELRYAGLPDDVYGRDDYAKWIGGNVSVKEISERAQLAGDLAVRKDPKLWKELESRGISKGDAAAYLLNPDKALPAIRKKLAGAEIGVAARESGMKLGNRFENQLVDKGVDAGQARQAFQAVAEDEADLDALAARYGDKEFGTKALVKGELGVGGAKAKKRRRELASRERAAWSGGGGGSTVFGNNSF